MRLIIPPQTLLRWHAVLVRRRWVYPCRTPRGPQAIRGLVLEMAAGQPGWGYRRHPRRADRPSVSSACPEAALRTQPRRHVVQAKGHAPVGLLRTRVGEQRSVTTALTGRCTRASRRPAVFFCRSRPRRGGGVQRPDQLWHPWSTPSVLHLGEPGPQSWRERVQGGSGSEAAVPARVGLAALTARLPGGITLRSGIGKGYRARHSSERSRPAEPKRGPCARRCAQSPQLGPD